MKTILHRAETRGYANHGWLDTHHTFSFAGYYNPERVNFGALRVLNDDIVDGGMGFGTHPHENMEIISIPLEGALEHKDSMGNTHAIKVNDVQVMSAGTGLLHSEYNHYKDRSVNFLQIWVFPYVKDVEPRYEQITYSPEGRKNQWQQIVSSSEEKKGLWIYQDVRFYLSDMDADITLTHSIKSLNHGVYLFLIDGEIIVNGEVLKKRDGIGITETPDLVIIAQKKSRVLLLEVPV